MSDSALPPDRVPSDPLTRLVRIFLESNLSIILIVFSLIVGGAALLVTPREEDPQIVVPLADIYVNFPGHSAAEVEQLVATPLERVLYQIDGVEYVYSQSRENQAIITVRFFVGQDRERSLVKLFDDAHMNLQGYAQMKWAATWKEEWLVGRFAALILSFPSSPACGEPWARMCVDCGRVAAWVAVAT